MKNVLAAALLVSALSSADAGAQAAAPSGEIAQIRAQIEALLQRVDRLEQQNADLSRENSELKAAGERGDAEREYLKAQTQDLRKESATVNSALAGLRGAEWAQRISLKGDFRYRHEEIFDDARAADGTLATADRYRDRLRVRAGLDARPTDNMLVSVQVATAEGGIDPRVGGDFRSSNQTLDGSNSRKNLYLDQAYFDWKFSSWGNLLGGKMRAPFVRIGQEQFIDGDINPEGLAVQFSRGIWFGSVYGTWMDEVAVKPAARKELAGRAIFTGYRRGAEYVATLRLMDVKVYLTPGSDGSCHAAREAMAMGVPLVAARRGHLVDLVDDGETGFLVDDDADQIANALLRMAKEPAFHQKLREQSHARAHKRYGLLTQARRVEAVYEELLG